MQRRALDGERGTLGDQLEQPQLIITDCVLPVGADLEHAREPPGSLEQGDPDVVAAALAHVRPRRRGGDRASMRLALAPASSHEIEEVLA